MKALELVKRLKAKPLDADKLSESQVRKADAEVGDALTELGHERQRRPAARAKLLVEGDVDDLVRFDAETESLTAKQEFLDRWRASLRERARALKLEADIRSLPERIAGLDRVLEAQRLATNAHYAAMAALEAAAADIMRTWQHAHDARCEHELPEMPEELAVRFEETLERLKLRGKLPRSVRRDDGRYAEKVDGKWVFHGEWTDRQRAEFSQMHTVRSSEPVVRYVSEPNRA